MKYFFHIFLYLNIYTIFSSEGFAQQLYFETTTENDSATKLIDSLSPIKTHKDFASIKENTDNSSLVLQQLGYIDSELKTLQKKNDSTFSASYFIGNKIQLLKIYYDTEDFSQKELDKISAKLTSSYFTIPFSQTETVLKTLNLIKTESGDAFAKVKLTNIKKEDNVTLSAKINLTNTKARIVDKIIVKEYEKFPASFLKYYAGIKVGTIFKQQEIIEKSKLLGNLGFVNNIKPPEVLFKKDSTIVYLYLKKETNNLFDGVIGFNTDETTNKLIFNGYLNLELNNNLNFGEQLLINYKADGNEQVNFNTQVSLPYLFKSPLGTQAELKIFKRDSTFITTEQSIQLNYQVSPSLKLNAGYKGYESSNLLDEANTSISIEDYTSRFFTSGFTYSKSQINIFYPVKTAIALTTEFGKRTNLGTDTPQTRGSIDMFHILNLNNKNAIYIRNSTSALFGDAFFTNELFRFGGINSIRGFNENSIDASLFSVLNTEYRYKVNNGLVIYSIIDFAYFENNINSIKENLYSFGFGTTLKTKAGLLSLIIANGSAKNQSLKFGSTKIHISLSSSF